MNGASEAMATQNWERMNRRVRAMHALWTLSTKELTTEQINYKERDGVLPLAFSLLHYVIGEDRNISLYVLDEPILWETGGWAERIGGKPLHVPRGTPIGEAETASIGDAGTWRAYQSAVFARTEQELGTQKPECFEHQVFETLPERLSASFVGLITPPGEPVLLGDLLDGFIYQHGIRHLGEMDHARSLVGLTGVN
jgi:hypothetical protein